ncbi:MAG: glycerol-3-phosphate acyltransferase [Mycobacterium leprae]
MLRLALVLVACYLIGSIPFPLLVSYGAMGIDLRRYGSGNMGATNAGRVLGKRWFFVVFALDCAKGALAAYLAGSLLSGVTPLSPIVAATLGGLAAVMGHCFPLYVGFKGGVGLAASAGALLLISPPVLLTAALVLLVVWAFSRNMYLGTVAAALTFPVTGWFWLRNGQVTYVLAVWGLLIAILHRKDLAAWWTRRSVQ